MIETRGLSKSFGAKVAVEGLNLEVGEGEVFGFLGPNGAGKTTTLRVLSCLISATSGEAWVAGWRVGQDDQRIRGLVGILTEVPGLYERLNASQNLDYYARLYGLPAVRRAAQIEKYLRLVGLWERRSEPVGRFSKGMQQKLAIARSLVHEPRVLLLDEPTAALDPESAHIVRSFIGQLRQEGRTIFLCTHNLDEADRLCDRIAIVRQRVLSIGSPSELRHRLFGRRIVAQLATVTPEVAAAVRRLPFVNGVEQSGNRLTVSLDDPERQNPTLVREMVLAGGQVQYVIEERASLEEVYLNLVSQDGEPTAARMSPRLSAGGSQ